MLLSCVMSLPKNVKFSFQYSIADFCNVGYLLWDLFTSLWDDMRPWIISYVAQRVSYLLVVRGYMEKFKGSKNDMIFTALQNTTLFHPLFWLIWQKVVAKFGNLYNQKTAIFCVGLSPLIDYLNWLVMNSCNILNVIHG